MPQKQLLDNKVLDFRGVLIDSSGTPNLVKRWSGYPDDIFLGGYRRLIKTENDRYFYFVEYGPNYGNIAESGAAPAFSNWRRLDIVACSPAREAYDNLFDSYDSCLEVDQFFPVFFNLDSIHTVADSTQLVLTDSNLQLNMNMVIDRIANDSASMWNEEKGFYNEKSSLSPVTGSGITYDDSDHMFYDGATYRKVEGFKSYSIRESIGDSGATFLVVQIDDDHDVFTSYIDSTIGINVVYYNTTDEEWQHRVFDDDSSAEEWEERSFFKDSDSTITSITDSSQNVTRPYYTYNTGLTYHLRDALGIYHFADYTLFDAVANIRNSGGEWKGTLDSLGYPWTTWPNKEMGFDTQWIGGPLRLDHTAFPGDSYLPVPIGVIGLDSL